MNLFKDTRLNISSENHDFGFHRIQKTTLQKIFHLRSLPTPGGFFFQKIDFFHFLIFCSTSYYKQNNAK